MATVPPAPSPPAPRDARYHSHPGRPKSKDEDARTPGELDRDRILYTSAFRRLAGVTQVVGAVEGHVFHNRLTHTIEVAQIARRLAERFIRNEPADRLSLLGGLDPDVTEAAALAHDLGHPPFGHIAEETLAELAIDKCDPDGFEGNAQSFRILTRLSAHRDQAGYEGLNLSRATLNAVLKYPVLKGGLAKKPDKYGAYSSEKHLLEWVRAGEVDDRPCLEAAIMDHADNIAYSVHDLDDFYRAGLIPLQEVWGRITDHIGTFRASRQAGEDKGAVDRHEKAIRSMSKYMPSHRRYEGTYEQRGELRACTSTLINLFSSTVTLGSEAGDGPRLEVPELVTIQMRFLQHLVWRYVIENPRLATQQYGQKRVIRTLYSTYHDAIVGRDRNLVPPAFLKQLSELGGKGSTTSGIKGREARLAADIVASFTDNQAVTLYRRLTGMNPGSVSDTLDG